MVNLCANAMDAMPKGGLLTIKTENVPTGEFCKEMDIKEVDRDYILLEIADTGSGIDQEILPRIFDPFFTTKETEKRTGFGLATVESIIKQNNGLIYVDSEPGKGTSFKIYLPSNDQSADEMQISGTQPVKGGTETILLAEDDVIVRNMVIRVLSLAGYKVLLSKDGEEALQVYHDNADAVDMALLDVKMPKKNGCQVMEQIRKENPNMKFLFCSGYRETTVHSDFMVDKSFNCLGKPYRNKELLLAVRRVLDAPPVEIE